jgi:hypothetical protein
MTGFAGIFEVLALDQSDARLASRKALVLSRDRIDARLGKFLTASQSPTEFAARYELVADDFAGIVRVAASEVGHEDPDSLIATLHDHYAAEDHWIQDAVKKPGDLHKKLHVPEDEKIPEEKIEDAEKSGDKNLKEKAQFAENVKGLGKKKKGKKNKKDKKDKDSKPPWLKNDDNDNDDGDDSLEFAAKTADAIPLAQAEARIVEALTRKDYNLLAGAIKSAPIDNHEEVAGHFADHLADTNERFDRERFIKASTPESTTTEASVHTADDKGNTGLGGPSPKMKKQRWTPKSVPHDEYDGGKNEVGNHEEKDITEVQPKNNLTGPAKDIPETGKAKEENLPRAKGLDDSGFEPSKNTGDSGPTKTFGKGNQTNPVTKLTIEKK